MVSNRGAKAPLQCCLAYLLLDCMYGTAGTNGHHAARIPGQPATLRPRRSPQKLRQVRAPRSNLILQIYARNYKGSTFIHFPSRSALKKEGEGLRGSGLVSYLRKKGSLFLFSLCYAAQVQGHDLRAVYQWHPRLRRLVRALTLTRNHE